MSIPNKFLTEKKFLEYQKLFYKEVINSPQTFSLTFLNDAVTPIGGTPHPLREFLKSTAGRSYEEVVQNDIKCLYELDIDNYTRSSVGLSDDSETVIYLSPLQIKTFTPEMQTHLGSFDEFLNKRDKIIVGGYDTHDSLYILERVTFLEQLYKSCLAIELTCKPYIRG